MIVEVRSRIGDLGSYLFSMIFSSFGDGGRRGISPAARVWGAGDDARRIAIFVTAMAGLALAVTVVYSRRGKIKSPWSRGRRKRALSPQQWRSMFTSDGKLQDGVKFLKIVRSGGIDHSIRAEVWPFLLGVYDLKSTDAKRKIMKIRRRKEYEKLRRHVHYVSKRHDESSEKLIEDSGHEEEDVCNVVNDPYSSGSEDVTGIMQPSSAKEVILDNSETHYLPGEVPMMVEEAQKNCTHADTSASDHLSDQESVSAKSPYCDLSDEESVSPQSPHCNVSDESLSPQLPRYAKEKEEHGPNRTEDNSLENNCTKVLMAEDFATLQRIIRLDAVRANDDWVPYSPTQAKVLEEKARQLASDVRLEDYGHLEPCRIFHASRLVAILEAYALYDPEIGYCQGMSDLLAPIITVVEDDYEAFWCFAGFMSKARHNFRLDEVGIRRQLNIVSRIIKYKDSRFFRHLEMLQAEDCFFVYRMVVVLFRRELSFEQILCLWEVMWADQAAIREGIGKSAWGRMRLRAPPTEDLLLYAIAACVLQRRKLIVEKYRSMDEIIRECNSMAGRLDVWKLLDDAHDLVVALHDRV